MPDDQPDITADDVERVRETVLDGIPDDAPDRYRAGAVEVAIEMDWRLTDPNYFNTDE